MNHSKTGCVRRFGSYTPEQLEKMRNDLGLSMSPQCLSFCATHYRVREKRDPRIDEIRMLDRLATLPADVRRTAVTELFTDDAFVAETYADMMRKRHELLPEIQTPPTFGELFGLANACLARAGKARGIPGIRLRTEIGETITDRFSVGAEDSDVTLNVTETPSDSERTIGDVFVLLERGELPMRKYREKIAGFLQKPEVSATLRDSRTVTSAGLLPLLLSYGSGLRIDLRTLGKTRDELPMELLVGCHEGYQVLLIPRSHASKITDMAKEAGFPATPFASLTDGIGITFLSNCNNGAFMIDSGLLRGLIPQKAESIRLPGENVPEADRLRVRPIGAERCRYLRSSVPTNTPVRPGNRLPDVSAAFCAPSKAIFGTVLRTALATVLSCASAGGDYTEARFAVTLKIPGKGSPESLGEALCAILALYRAQTELGIPAAGLSLLSDETAEHPEVTVFCAFFGKEIKGTFQENGNRICAVSPVFRPDGLPDFALFRSLLQTLRNEAQNGKIRSFRLLCDESVTTGMRRMERNGKFCRLLDTSVASENALPLGLLLETVPESPFTPVGIIETRPDPVCDEADENFLLLPEHSLVWSERPEITVRYCKGDADARLMIALLEAGHVTVSGFTTDPEETGPFSKAILTSGTLILCDGVALPEDKRTRFAVDVLLRSGGKIVSLGEHDRIPATVPHRHCPDGIRLDFDEND